MVDDPHSSELAQTLFTESQDAVFIVDGDQRKLLDANRAAQKFMGLNHHDLLAARFDHIFQWQDNNYAQFADVSQDAREAPPYRPAVLHTRKAGLMPVHASVIPLPGTKT